MNIDTFREVSQRDLKYAEELSNKGEYKESYDAVLAIMEKIPTAEGEFAYKIELINALSAILIVLVGRIEVEKLT